MWNTSYENVKITLTLPHECFVFYFLHDTCSLLLSFFPVVDLLSHTEDVIDDVPSNILTILFGIDSFDQRLKKKKNG